MNVSLGTAPEKYDRSTWQQILGQVAQAFARVQNWQRIQVKSALNFAAPGAVPGFTDQTVTLLGAELGDPVSVGCSITAPAGFMPPVGFVSAANTVTVRWLQVSGAAANPDGGGADYTINVWRQ